MKATAEQDERIARMTFASVYPHYVTKVEKKGRTVDELHQVIEWLTGYNADKLRKLIEEKVTFETFFENATLHPNAELITGVICGYRVEEIEFPLSRQARYLDKLVDELNRKSTRLNSSHVKISYAVFCLKKKNKNSSDSEPRQ